MSNETKNILPELPSGAELEEERDARFLPQDEWEDVDISGDWLDVTEEFQRPRWTLAFNGTPFAPLGGLHSLNGLPGHGKTMTFTQLMVAVLKGSYGPLTYELKDEIPEPRVLYIDTEMEKGNTQLVNLRVYSMMNWSYGVPHDEFRVIMLRETEKAVDRWRKILKAIYEVRPTVCFIDGMLDVVSDFNDNKECQEVIYKCMKMASYYQMSLWGLVHLNPNGAKAVGHMGSILDRKITDGLKTTKQKDPTTGEVTFTVSQTKARGKDLPDWDFKVRDDRNKFGIPEILGEGESDTTSMLWAQFRGFMPALGLNTRDLRAKVTQGFRVDETEATRIIQKAVDSGVLHKEEEWNASHTKLMKCRFTLLDKPTDEDDRPF